MRTSRNTPLKLLPSIATDAQVWAGMLCLPFSQYVSALLWNYAQHPVRLVAEPDSRRLNRVQVPCTVRAVVWSQVMPHVTASALSANAFIEAIIARDLRSGESGLLLLPRRGSGKPRL